MPLNPAALQSAFVATPNPAGSQAFGPTGIGLVVRKLNTPIFVKFEAIAGNTYTVSTNVIPGDLVVTGPNGGPLNPGGAIKAFSFTPNQNGLYVVGFVANPRFVATGQPIFVSIQANQTGLPTTVEGAEQVLSDPVGAALRIANGQGITQYYLHAPDNNANGLGTAAPDNPVTPNGPLLAGMANDAATTDDPADPVLASIDPVTPTPLETAANGKPISWAPNSPPGDPTVISLALEGSNFPSDAGNALPFASPFPSAFTPLLLAAEDIWEASANIKFVNTIDSTSSATAPDVRVGLATLSKAMDVPNEIGFTHYSWDANNNFRPDNLVEIDDPNDRTVKALADGDFQYIGFQTTVFQDLLHELGHAIGLAHNPNDPTSIMNPVLTTQNPLPNAADIASLQSLYGAPTVTFSDSDIAALRTLVFGPNAMS